VDTEVDAFDSPTDAAVMIDFPGLRVVVKLIMRYGCPATTRAEDGTLPTLELEEVMKTVMLVVATEGSPTLSRRDTTMDENDFPSAGRTGGMAEIESAAATPG